MMMRQTAISTKGFVTCECGAQVEMDMTEYNVRKCESCQKGIWVRKRYLSAMNAMAAFGVQIEIDWDGQLLVNHEGELPETARDWIFQNQAEIRSTIEHRGRNEQSVFCGGTLSGQKHNESSSWGRNRVHQHIGIRHWETYEFRDRKDPRLFYVGKSTSKAKARIGEFETASGKNK